MWNSRMRSLWTRLWARLKEPTWNAQSRLWKPSLYQRNPQELNVHQENTLNKKIESPELPAEPRELLEPRETGLRDPWEPEATDLRATDLRETDPKELTETDLKEIDLMETDPRGAGLRETDLRETDPRELTDRTARSRAMWRESTSLSTMTSIPSTLEISVSRPLKCDWEDISRNSEKLKRSESSRMIRKDQEDLDMLSSKTQTVLKKPWLMTALILTEEKLELPKSKRKKELPDKNSKMIEKKDFLLFL
jgi:hypothetical protein